MIERVYDAFMPILCRVRPFVCLLLAVSTAIGATVPTRACGCTPAARNPAPPESPTQPLTSSAPKPQPCCDRPCCAVNRTAATPGCCCEMPAQADEPRPDQGDSPEARPARCDCDAPGLPPPPATPSPAGPDLSDAGPASVVPPAFVAGPPTAVLRAARSCPMTPPTDLTISLSRLTC